ncbi:MAG: glutathione S-transferase N-terminal domain-containing protein [Pseudomonadota bacterium]
MIQFYSWSTPNGRKVSIALEEMDVPYTSIPVDITKGEQFAADFLAVSPNNKIPAIRDGEIAIFESGAILLYLAEKTGRFMPEKGSPEYWTVMQWLMWQMGGFGPIIGQAHHFLHFNPGKSEYAEQRFHTEAKRLYGVLDKQLTNADCVAGALSIADFAIWPWASRFDYHKVDLNEYPHVKRWYLALAQRPGFQRGYAEPVDVGPIPLP